MFYHINVIATPTSTRGANGLFDNSTVPTTDPNSCVVLWQATDSSFQWTLTPPMPPNTFSGYGDKFSVSPGDSIQIELIDGSSSATQMSVSAIYGRGRGANGGRPGKSSPFTADGTPTGPVSCVISASGPPQSGTNTISTPFATVQNVNGNFRFLIVASLVVNGTTYQFVHDPEMDVSDRATEDSTAAYV